MIIRMLIFNLIYLLLFNVLSDFYFYKYAVCRLTKNKILRASHWALDALFVLAIAVLFWFVSEDGGIPHSVYQTFMLIYVLVYVPKLAFMLFSFPIIFSNNRTFRRIFTSIGAFIGLIIFLSVLYGATIGRNSIRVTEIEIGSDKLPAGFNDYRIVHLSDIHLGNMSNDKLLKKVLRETEQLSADMIIFSGDLVHSRTNEAYAFESVVKQFTAPDGVYTVLGNHDYGDYTEWTSKEDYVQNGKDLEAFYERVGWQLMNNSSVVIDQGADSIALIGVENWGEPPFPQHGKLAVAMEGIDSTMYKILISHNPKHWTAEVKDKTDIDLTLAGHTHAMQLSVKLFGKRYSPSSLKYDLWGGLYSSGSQHLIINEGIGVVLFPFRLGATPEITVITLKKE